MYPDRWVEIQVIIWLKVTFRTYFFDYRQLKWLALLSKQTFIEVRCVKIHIKLTINSANNGPWGEPSPTKQKVLKGLRSSLANVNVLFQFHTVNSPNWLIYKKSNLSSENLVVHQENTLSWWFSLFLSPVYRKVFWLCKGEFKYWTLS